MILFWLTTGVAAAQEGVEPPVEQRGKGGRGWLLHEEHQYRPEAPLEPAVTVETIREAADRIAARTAPPAPEPEVAAPPTAPVAPTRQVAAMFEQPANVVPIERPAPPERPLSETERAALGARKIERTYDLELLLLLAA